MPNAIDSTPLKSRRARRPKILSSLALAAAVLMAPACSNENAKSASNSARVLTVHVTRILPQTLDRTLDTTGSLVSSVAVGVKTEFAGRLVAMSKQEGDRVSQGELVAQLDEVNAHLGAEQARAALEVARASLERARVAEKHARSEFERAQNLLKSGGITDQGFQAATVAAQDAQAQVQFAQAQVDQATQALAMAEKHLRDCRITSPISGEVERKFVNPGSWVDGNTLLYRLVDNQRLELETFAASSDLGQVARGQKIRFTVAAYPDEVFEASITAVGAAVDPQNRSAVVRAAVPNPSGKLKAGMFAKGKIVTGTRPESVVVPSTALWRRSGQAPYVYVVEQNRARKRQVQMGQEDSMGIEILTGLKPGETVVADQNLELAEGVALSPQL
ncbi:MAG TPA: efflux RND transporter periplasmic adaptor subunit [Terriglobia bacterium]|nr:efflux RND transporter periplasmic adaptor subunit [Terriglobia bacterium]